MAKILRLGSEGNKAVKPDRMDNRGKLASKAAVSKAVSRPVAGSLAVSRLAVAASKAVTVLTGAIERETLEALAMAAGTILVTMPVATPCLRGRSVLNLR